MVWVALVAFFYGLGSGAVLLRAPAFAVGTALVAAGYCLLAATRGEDASSITIGALVVLVCVQIGYALGLAARALAGRLFTTGDPRGQTRSQATQRRGGQGR